MATAVPQGFDFKVSIPQLATVGASSPVLETKALNVRVGEVRRPALGRFEAAARYGEPRVVLDVESTTGRSEVELPLTVRELDDGRTEVTGRAYRLWLRLLFEEEGGQIDWRLDPGGSDAAGRARLVDLLTALAGRGSLILKDPDGGAIASVALEGSSKDASLVEERSFLTQILVIEAWSGMRLRVPDDPSDLDLHVLGQLRAWTNSPIAETRFVGPITGVVDEPPEGADRLTLHQDWHPELFGMPIRMGRFDYDVRVRYVSADELEDGRLLARFEPLEDGASPMRLNPPRGSSAVDATAAAAGALPARPRRQNWRASQDRSRRLAASWELEDPEDEQERDEIRRRWPT